MEKNKEWIARVAEDMQAALGYGDHLQSFMAITTAPEVTTAQEKTSEEMLAAVKDMQANFYANMVQALVDGVNIEWDERNLARLVQKYA